MQRIAEGVSDARRRVIKAEPRIVKQHQHAPTAMLPASQNSPMASFDWRIEFRAGRILP